MKRIITQGMAFVLAISLLSLGCSSKGKALAKVGGEVIYSSDIDEVIDSNPRLKSAHDAPEIRKKILDKYIEQTLLYQESLRRGLHRNEAVKDRIELSRQGIIAMAAVEDEIKKKSKEYYDAHQDEFEPLQMSHIYIPFKTDKNKKVTRSEKSAEELAQKTKGRLDQGEDFAALAIEISEDARTKNNGGSLGKVTPSDRNFQKNGWSVLIEKALAMKKDELVGPVKSENGFHIIKLQEEKNLQAFEEVEPQIQFKVQGQARAELLASIKTKTKVKMMDEAKPENNTAPTAAAPAPAVGQK